MGKSRRLKFHSILEKTLGSEEEPNTNVYFQPPPNKQMQYPCIVYERDDIASKYADNLPYSTIEAYQVTHIAQDPDSDVVVKLAAMPLSEFSRHFATSGLNHDVFVIHH